MASAARSSPQASPLTLAAPAPLAACRVVQGLEVVDRIAAVPTGAQGPFPAWVPTAPVVIERVQLLEPAVAP